MPSIEFPEALTTETFIKQYWQKKPLYMPQAWTGFENPLVAEELAGLALEQAFPSRIVVQHSANKWSVRQGPFTSNNFAELEGQKWSLLITDIEKHLPDFKAYLEPFRFIPDWRFDDLMISYAPPGGSVGPHIDDYDTFLIQVEGERRWRLENKFRQLPQASDDLIKDTELRLIKHFKTAHEYSCQAGDILYLPPRLGHYGVAQTHCMTWSIGFKAPSAQDMLMDYLDDFQHDLEHKRFTDPDLKPPANPGEISAKQLGNLKQWFTQQIELDDEAFYRWAGKFLSRNSFEDIQHQVRFDEPLFDDLQVETNSFMKFNYIKINRVTYLFVDGDEYIISQNTAKLLTTNAVIKLQNLNQQDEKVVVALLRKGALVPC